jgi:flavodoxin I
MKVLISYDSVHGNTEKIAKAIGDGMTAQVEILHASEVTNEKLSSVDLLVVGSPTYGGKPTPTMQALLERINESSIKGVRIAAFDTRLSSRFVRLFGFAAEKISSDLAGKGGAITAPPEGFFVKGRTGPLKQGELERAAAWGKTIAI